MPSHTQWFKVTQDINADPEMWELRETFGDRAGFLWLEMLSIAARNKGVVGPDNDYTWKQLAIKCRITTVRSRIIGGWMTDRRWINRGATADERRANGQRMITIVKWLKYNRVRVADETLLKEKKIKEKIYTDDPPQKPDMTVQEFVESWNEWFDGSLPKVEWPLSPSRAKRVRLRLSEHKSNDFWEKVFSNIQESQFLLGNGKGNWRCTLDFVVANDTNSIKIYEGVYNGQGHQTG